MAEHTDSSFYVTGGTLRHDAPSYVERQADKDLLDGLLEGEFCYVLTSRQMGKSSLMVRTAGKLREQGVQVVVLDLTAIGQNLTPEQWYDGLLVRMGRQLRLEDELEEFWESKAQLGPCQRFFTALREVVMTRLSVVSSQLSVAADAVRSASPRTTDNGPRTTDKLVIFVDEIDVVRSLPFSTDEFFAALRECYNRRTEDAEFNRLTFCLLGVATPSDLIRDTRTTPFNIGRRIALNDFTPEEAVPLAEGLCSKSSIAAAENSKLEARNSKLLLARVLYWTNGHPYLTQRLCQALAADAGVNGAPEVDEMCEALFFATRAREQDDNLLFVRERLLRADVDRASLLHLYEQVVARKRVLDDETNPLVTALRLSGVTRARREFLVERNRIYERVFDRKWVKSNMPDAELRRQREAFRRGVFRATAVAATVITLLFGALVYARYQARRADANAQTANQQRRLAQERLYLSDMNLAYQALYAGNLGRARNLLEAHRRQQPDFRNFEWRYLWQRCRGDHAYELVGHSQSVSQVAWSKDGGRLASRSLDDVLIVWDLPARRPALLLTNATALGGFSPDGSSVAVGRGNDLVAFYDFRTGEIRYSFEHLGHLLTLVADGQRLVTISGGDAVKFWDIATGAETFQFRNPGSIPRVLEEDTWGVDVTPDGTRLAVANVTNQVGEGVITIWDVPSNRAVASLPSLPFPQRRLCFAPDGQRLAVGGLSGAVNLWSTGTNEEPKLIQAHEVTIRALAFSPEGRTLATGSSDQTIRLWDVATGTNLGALLGHENGVRCLAFSPDGQQLASGSRDETVKVWNLNRTPPPDSIPDVAAFDTPNKVLFSPSAKMLASSCLGNNLKVWELATLRELVSWPGEEVPLTFSADEHELLTLDPRNFKLYWRELRNPASHRSIALQDPPTWRTDTRVCFGTNANLLAIGDLKGAIHLWEIATGEKLAVLSGHAGRISALAFSPDAKLLVSAGQQRQFNSTLYFWDLPKRQLIGSILAHKSSLDRLSFSPDSSVLASASGDNTVKLWDVTSRTILGTLKGHRQSIFGVAFSPDGKELASGSSDGTIKIWNVAMQQEAATIPFHETERKGIERIWTVEFSPDGSTLAALTWDNELRFWRAPSLAEIDAKENSGTRKK